MSAGKRVLIARQDNDGDVLLAGPAIRAVADGAGHVTLLCGPRGRAAAELLPGVDDIVVWRADWIDPEPQRIDPGEVMALVTALGDRGFEQAIVMTSFHQSPLPLALLLRLARVPQVAATSTDYPGSLLDIRHAIDDDVHEVQRSLSLVGTLGYALGPEDDGALMVRRPERAGRSAVADGPYVVVHPGASMSARAWAPERHAELVEVLAASGRRVVVTGGPDEAGLTAEVAGPPRPGVLDLGGATTLAGLAEVLADADAVVVGNTGPAHLAAAVGTPVVSLYAPTVPPARWRPWGVPHALLYTEVPCAGCRARECPVAGHPCLGMVAVDAVVTAIERLCRAPAPEVVAA